MGDQHHPSARCDWQYLKVNSWLSLNDNLHSFKRNNTRISASAAVEYGLAKRIHQSLQQIVEVRSVRKIFRELVTRQSKRDSQ